MFWIDLIRPTRILIAVALVFILFGPALLAIACASVAKDPLPPPPLNRPPTQGEP